MKQDQFESIYGLSQEEKESLIKNLSQDIAFTDEAFYDESMDDFEAERELFDNEMYLDDTEEVA